MLEDAKDPGGGYPDRASGVLRSPRTAGDRMDLLVQTGAYVAENADRFRQAALVHLGLSFGALGIAMLIFIPLGVLASTGGRLTANIVGAVAAVRVIPSLAVILLLLPVYGL